MSELLPVLFFGGILTTFGIIVGYLIHKDVKKQRERIRLLKEEHQEIERLSLQRLAEAEKELKERHAKDIELVEKVNEATLNQQTEAYLSMAEKFKL